MDKSTYQQYIYTFILLISSYSIFNYPLISFILIIIFYKLHTYINKTLNSFIFCPSSPQPLEKYNELKKNNSNVKIIDVDDINIIMIQKSSEKCLLYSHGNGHDAFEWFDRMKILSDGMDMTVITYDYHGYGLSKGTLSEKGCYKSMMTVVDYVVNTLKYKKENIYLIGNSLGTAVVVDYISKISWDTSVILLSPFKSIISISTDFDVEYYNSLSKTHKLLIFLLTRLNLKCLVDKFVTIDKINTITCPIKIYHGKQDALVPTSHSKELYEKLINKKYQPSYLEDAEHHNIFEYITIESLEEVVKS